MQKSNHSPNTEYLSEIGVHELTGMTLSRLRADRFHRRGLPYSKVGRSVFYKLDDVRRFMDQHKVVHEVEV